MSPSDRAVMNGLDLERVALEKARALARAIGGSPVFKEFEAAHEALIEDGELSQRLDAFQQRQQELLFARAWGGADPVREQALEAEWQTLSHTPTLRAHLKAQRELTALFREVAGIISQEIGIDYGAACSPGGGCC